MNLNLKGRLKLIADKVPTCNLAADIGTDHAYIPIYLVQQGICKRAVASDVNIGPVNIAKENIDQYNLKEKIEIRLGNGLDTIGQNEADTIIIAGMGGTLVTELLEANISKANNANALILQPMNDFDIVRKWLYDHKFDIYDEEMVAEGTKMYFVISARSDSKEREYSLFELHIGEKLINKRDPLLIPYCEMKVRQINTVLAQLEAKENNSSLKNYYLKLKQDYKDLIEIIRVK